MAPHMQRLLAAAGHAMPQSAPSLEINPEHPLLKRYVAEADASAADDLGWLLLEQAQLTAGAALDDAAGFVARVNRLRSEEHTSELQSLMRISYAVFCLNKKTKNKA